MTDSIPFSKVPPQSVEAEQAILAAMFFAPERINAISAEIDREDFYKQAHRHIFDSMLELSDTGKAVDLVTVGENLESKNLVNEIGGHTYLSLLVDHIPMSSEIDPYIQLLLKKSITRQLITAATEIVTECYADDANPIDLVASAKRKIDGILL